MRDDSFLGVDVELDSVVGAYVRVGGDFEGVLPYLLLGFARTEVTASAGGLSASDDESDFSYGIGLDVGSAENLSFNIEYMNYYDDSDGDITAIGVGITSSF